MEFAHITPEFMDAVVSGDLAGEVFAVSLWKHLQEVCPECSEGFQRVEFRMYEGVNDHRPT